MRAAHGKRRLKLKMKSGCRAVQLTHGCTGQEGTRRDMAQHGNAIGRDACEWYGHTAGHFTGVKMVQTVRQTDRQTDRQGTGSQTDIQGSNGAPVRPTDR